MNICPKDAIFFKEDNYGFLYPFINLNKCVYCGMCKKICGYQKKTEVGKVHSTWVAAITDQDMIKKSASGGVFAAIALEVLKNNGVVFGCSLEMENGQLTPKHIKVTIPNDLVKLQGSKYVQSYIGNIYKEVEMEVLLGKDVLFSGTPCQVAGLKSYLTKEYENLFLIDIICHGVPNAAFFQAYLRNLEGNLKGKITDFMFRDKTKGWGHTAMVKYYTVHGEKRTKLLTATESSYYNLFLNSDTYRESCYSCKYANKHRVGDLTIGDYWGIKKEHPEYLINYQNLFDEKKGISCILVNTEQGKNMLNRFGTEIQLKPSTFQKAAAMNDQLRTPSSPSDIRKEIFEIYKNDGYDAVEKWYGRKLGLKKYAYIVWNLIPIAGQRMLKGIRNNKLGKF